MPIFLKNTGQIAWIDCLDYEIVAAHSWYATKTGYASTSIKHESGRKNTYMHALLVGRHSGLLIDHLDGDGLNNRRANLRLATAQQNSWNARRRAGRKLPRGVSEVEGGFTARIFVSGVDHYLGFFKDADVAAEAYRAASLLHHGEFSPMASA